MPKLLSGQSLVVHNIGISSSSVFPRQPVRCFVPPPFPLILLTISAIKTTFIPVTSTRKIAQREVFVFAEPQQELGSVSPPLSKVALIEKLHG